jgi:lysophospholipase L1-like esterase
MMAIGDSLFNGVRSLTIDPQLAQWSAPKQVATALGIDFAVPDYPTHVVVDFENWVREFPDIARILNEIKGSIDAWNGNPKSTLEQFDNIAIAATTWSDLYSRTWKTAQDEVDNINQNISQGKTTYLDNLSEFFFAFNTRFILNPSRSQTTPALSSLDIVANRKPTRLIVSIGANNGLWQMAFDAASSPGFDTTKGHGIYGDADVADCKQFLTRLAKLPPDIEHIYINALPYPNTTANMMPIPDSEINSPPKAGKLWAEYENRFGFTYGTLTGSQLKKNNKTVSDLAKFISSTIKEVDDPKSPRMHVVPIDEIFLEYDYKTDRSAEYVSAPDDKRKKLSNIFIDSYTDFRRHWYGGLIGLDGMHPTIVGYNLMANAILDTINKFEPELKIPDSLPTAQDAYQADTLLTNFPPEWDFILYSWRDIRRAFNVGLALPDDEQTRSVKSLMGIVSRLRSGPARKLQYPRSKRGFLPQARKAPRAKD